MGMLEDAKGAIAARQSKENRWAEHVSHANARFRNCVSECAKEFTNAAQIRGIPHDSKVNFKRVWLVHVSIPVPGYEADARQHVAVFENGDVVCVDRNSRGRVRTRAWSNVEYMDRAQNFEAYTRESFTRALERRISQT